MFNRFFNQLSYAISGGWKFFLISIALSLLLLFIIIYSQPPNPTQLSWWTQLRWWTNWIDPLIGMFTFLIALAVWWSNTKEDWEDDLEKRLTVNFRYGKRIILKCNEAYLASEGDIRNWSQQIGSQMAHTRFLKFLPNIDQDKPNVLLDQVENKFYKLYTVTFTLTELPNVDAEHKVATEQRFKDGCIIWNGRATKAEDRESFTKTEQ